MQQFIALFRGFSYLDTVDSGRCEVLPGAACGISGRSAARLARLVRDQEVPGSNPGAPTTMGNMQKPRDRQGIAAFAWKRVSTQVGTRVWWNGDAEEVKAYTR